METTTNNDDSSPDKLRDGPCAKDFLLLEECRKRKNVQKATNAMTFCVSETDLLIRCVRRHPAHFGPKLQIPVVYRCCSNLASRVLMNGLDAKGYSRAWSVVGRIAINPKKWDGPKNNTTTFQMGRVEGTQHEDCLFIHHLDVVEPPTSAMESLHAFLEPLASASICCAPLGRHHAPSTDMRRPQGPMSPEEYASMILTAADNVDTDIPKFAEALASEIPNFTCAHLVAALTHVPQWDRAMMVRKVLIHCQDLEQRHSQIQRHLTPWERSMTDRAFKKALEEQHIRNEQWRFDV